MIGSIKYYSYIGNQYKIRMGKLLYGGTFGEYGLVYIGMVQGCTIGNHDFLTSGGGNWINLYAFSSGREDIWR